MSGERSQETALLRAAEAARLVGVAPSTFRCWVTRKGYITPVALPDGARRFRPADVAWLREQVRRNEAAR